MRVTLADHPAATSLVAVISPDVESDAVAVQPKPAALPAPGVLSTDDTVHLVTSWMQLLALK